MINQKKLISISCYNKSPPNVRNEVFWNVAACWLNFVLQ